MVNIKHILVPIDFSDPSKNALAFAIDFAGIFKADLTLLYVVEPVIYPADFSFGQVTVPSMEVELTSNGEKKLRELATPAIEKGITVQTEVKTGKAFVEIVKYAREKDMDLIIIATHGHSAFENVLFGSTAEKVVRKAPCAVLTLRPDNLKFVMP